MVRYLTVDELVYINAQFLPRTPIHTIVEGKRAVRDMGLLEAAAARPMQSVFGEDAYPTLEDKATALLHSIARNHAFADGNKRTGTVAAAFMLAVNGRRVNWKADEALERIVGLAEGGVTPEDFAAWLPTEAGDSALEADAERDMALIAAILSEHRWLLEALAGR
ncbi:MAG: type II toxin-antitoxin system death-on-curing family toxin [Anaerolineae bacterium]|nr:type II toxin-antitoxin system death-on-curing family toxin [Anaerolineae bacterium]